MVTGAVAPGDAPRRAVIDIGSNSVRIVIYGGPPRAPATLFNEKVMAGLGAGLAGDGRIADAAMARALRALDRFGSLARTMQVASLRIVATAAVRDAVNGGNLIASASQRGLTVELLPGEQEGVVSAMGVISAFPDANGLVADLGGGSLELARIADGQVHERVSLPLGVLRVPALRAGGREGFDRTLDKLLRAAGWSDTGPTGTLYLVGGSFRSLARIDMVASDYPLRVVHAYAIDVGRADRLGRVIAAMVPEALGAVPGLSNSRIPTLPAAASLLSALTRRFAPSAITVSAYGLREGLLFSDLDEATRSIDPLIAATEEMDRAESRFPAHGRLLARWIAPLFASDPPQWERLRRAACNLGDVAWRANPDFRAERGLEIAIHGNWVGIDGPGREMLGQAIFTCFGGGVASVPGLGSLAGPEAMRRAAQWGMAMRLGQRLSGGTRPPLEASRLVMGEKKLELVIDAGCADLAGEAVSKRLSQLAALLGVKGRVSVAD